MSDANIAVVKQGFERFLAGDIPGFIELLTSDIVWDHRGPEGVPYNRMYEGREDVVGFFQTLDELLENVSFDVNEYFASGDRVVSVGHFSWKVKANNKVWASDFAMIYTVRDGRVTHWKPIFDMGTEAAAFQP
jgi:ketosteroid isomerase-like protein